MAFESEDFAASRGVPHFRRPILAAGEHPLAVGAESHAGDGAVVTGEGLPGIDAGRKVAMLPAAEVHLAFFEVTLREATVARFKIRLRQQQLAGIDQPFRARQLVLRPLSLGLGFLLLRGGMGLGVLRGDPLSYFFLPRARRRHRLPGADARAREQRQRHRGCRREGELVPLPGL